MNIALIPKLKRKIESSANLCKENLHRFDLRGLDFSGKGLSHTNFSQTVLTCLIFWGANLQHAVVDDARLNKTDFQGVNLSFASVQIVESSDNASFRGSNLIESNMTRSNFRNRDCSNTKIENAL